MSEADPPPAGAAPTPPGPGATGLRVLVVEDVFLTAESLAAMLRELGHSVAGPTPTVAGAHTILDAEPVDVALLDVNLRGQLVTPVADRLVELGRPFVFLTAYSGLDVLPDRHQVAPRLTKPCTRQALAEALAALA